MSQLGTKNPKYKDGRTKQSFRDETDINMILKRAQKSGTISHLNQFEARYGDFSGFDFFEAQLQLARGGEIFDALPMELRREFNQSPSDFFKYVNDPENKDRLKELLPGLAEPGRQNLKTTAALSADETLAAEKAAEPLPEPTAPKAPESAPPAPVEPPVPTT